jgi:hypothetical protein
VGPTLLITVAVTTIHYYDERFTALTAAATV